MESVRAVAFDCDGVLADAGSSWAVIHSHFGTGDATLLTAFLNQEISDAEFMRDDIRQWKEVQPKIHRDELFRCYSGVQLMEGARDVVSALMNLNVLCFFQETKMLPLSFFDTSCLPMLHMDSLLDVLTLHPDDVFEKSSCLLCFHHLMI